MSNYQAKKNIFFNGNFEKNHPVQVRMGISIASAARSLVGA